MSEGNEEHPTAEVGSGRPETRLYLLTLLREEDGGRWRATLRPAGGGPRLGFADVEQLAAYLLRLADGED